MIGLGSDRNTKTCTEYDAITAQFCTLSGKAPYFDSLWSGKAAYWVRQVVQHVNLWRALSDHELPGIGDNDHDDDGGGGPGDDDDGNDNVEVGLPVLFAYSYGTSKVSCCLSLTKYGRQ